jgi:hypothetical protein
MSAISASTVDQRMIKRSSRAAPPQLIDRLAG